MWNKINWALALWAWSVLASKTYPAEFGMVMNTVSNWVNSILSAVSPYAAAAAPFALPTAAAAIPWYYAWKKWWKIAWVWAWAIWLWVMTWWALIPGLSAYWAAWFVWWIKNKERGVIDWAAYAAFTYWLCTINPAFIIWGLWLYWTNNLIIPWIKAWAKAMQDAASWTYAKTLWRFKTATP